MSVCDSCQTRNVQLAICDICGLNLCEVCDEDPDHEDSHGDLRENEPIN
jgi:hypothetical protein